MKKKKLARAISGRVKTLRERAEISQQELATRAKLSLSLVAKIEQGKKVDPRASTLIALAGALKVKPGELLDGLPVVKEEPAPAEKPVEREVVERNGSYATEQLPALSRDGIEEDGDNGEEKKEKVKKKAKGKKRKVKKEA